MTLLTDKDKQSISEVIRKAEGITSGEIVFAITNASDSYQHATLQGAFVGMLAATAVYFALPVAHTMGILLWTQLVSFACLYALLPQLPWRRWFIPARELEARVQEAAFMEFYSSGLHRTRAENGILIYLSYLERRVVVIGDRGIHEKMGDRHWTGVRDQIISGIREGRAREGICAAIESCGKALAEHFPYQVDDINELPDHVIDRTRGSGAP